MTRSKNKTALPKPLWKFMHRAPDGHVAEWLRSGLQNRLPRFNSGRGLQETSHLADDRWGAERGHPLAGWGGILPSNRGRSP